MNNSVYVRLGFEFEKIVSQIFEKHGFSITIADLNCDQDYDIAADGVNNKLAIEVKISRNINISRQILLKASQRLAMTAVRAGRIPVLVAGGVVSKYLRNELENIKDFVVCDIQNLLYLVKDDEILRSRLVAILSFSIDDLEAVKPDKILAYTVPIKNKSATLVRQLTNKLKVWKPEDGDSAGYEILCTEVLQILFSEDLSLWKTQQKSNSDLFRFDLICKVKDNNEKEFWNMVEKYFQSKYIIFKFKNYTNEITQKEIFTTEKYLYSKALRRVAIVISTKGTDKNADKAIRGILREEGKLIISLSNEELIQMLMLRENNDIPSDYLSNKLDQLLIDLEK
ncbi:hypothetical protein CLNEO_11010 [Anaerotignum neopropionicum]|uniref:Restriction endonuclease type IV Mrr domain-containing protein n=1 Tax=Anaerotignum neopropionicum TaxID=36847 RepID=A0A136WH67_9FIRM|nr:hypothetical protein [Anaerotignum neopropionicum]KXL53875.1 hypothetical protein CLNEO_11010 [Anaerotignum neopropionicum]